MKRSFGDWQTWILIALTVQVLLILPYFGEETTQYYGFAEFVSLLISEVGLVGGALFRAGMLYARRHA
jgi:hypothetical protein